MTFGQCFSIEITLFEIPLELLAINHFESYRLHQKLHHPGILSLLSTFQTSVSLVQVLEPYAPRCSIYNLLESNSPGFLSESTLRRVLTNILSAACYLQTQGTTVEKLDTEHVVIANDDRVVSIISSDSLEKGKLMPGSLETSRSFFTQRQLDRYDISPFCFANHTDYIKPIKFCCKTLPILLWG